MGLERSCQLGAMTDAELPEDMREMPLHRAIREEQGGGNLLIRLSLGHEGRDALLGRCQRAGRRRASADPLELRPSALRPERGTDPLEDAERLLECRPRLASSLHAASGGPECKKCAPAVEWELDRSVAGERLLVGPDRIPDFPFRCCEQPATAHAVGQRRCAFETTRIAFVPVEKLGGLVLAPELDERLYLVGNESGRPRLDDELSPYEVDRPVEVSYDLTRRTE